MVLLLQEKILAGSLSGSVFGFPLEPGQDVLWWSGMWKGEEGKKPGMIPIPYHLMHSQELPISTQGKKRLLCIPHSLVKAERLAIQSPLGEGKGPFLFLKQKRSLTLGFP